MGEGEIPIAKVMFFVAYPVKWIKNKKGAWSWKYVGDEEDIIVIHLPKNASFDDLYDAVKEELPGIYTRFSTMELMDAIFGVWMKKTARNTKLFEKVRSVFGSYLSIQESVWKSEDTVGIVTNEDCDDTNFVDWFEVVSYQKFRGVAAVFLFEKDGHELW